MKNKVCIEMSNENAALDSEFRWLADLPSIGNEKEEHGVEEIPVKDVDDAKKINDEFRQKYTDLSRELTEAKNRLFELKDLPKVADTMFRFLAGVDFSDHSIADQRQFLELMSSLKIELNRAGIGSRD